MSVLLSPGPFRNALTFHANTTKSNFFVLLEKRDVGVWQNLVWLYYSLWSHFAKNSFGHLLARFLINAIGTKMFGK